MGKVICNTIFNLINALCTLVFQIRKLLVSICCWYSFELPRLVEAIQMCTNNICLYEEVDKSNLGCNLKSKKLIDCGLTGLCMVIRSNMVFLMYFRHCVTVGCWSFIAADKILFSIQTY